MHVKDIGTDFLIHALLSMNKDYYSLLFIIIQEKKNNYRILFIKITLQIKINILIIMQILCNFYK